MDSRNGEGDASSTQPANNDIINDSTREPNDAQKSTSPGLIPSEESAPSKISSKASSTRNSTPAASSAEADAAVQKQKDASDSSAAMSEAKETVPGASDPVQSSSKDTDENGAAPYGTRSRNRPGRSRPNYAEDTEMDFEMTAPSSNGHATDLPSRNLVVAEGTQSSGVGAKKGSGSAQGNGSWGNSGANTKDEPANPNISGTSAVTAANPPSAAQPATKRRKNAAAATNGVHQNAAAPAQTGPKRGNQVMVAAQSARESNMLTFENTGAILQNGHMEADDGQTVSVNGKS